MKKYLHFCLLTIIALSLLLSSCTFKPTAKDDLLVFTTDAVYTTEQLINEADLILKGRVASVDGGVMTNPKLDRNIKDDNGRTVNNEQIHTYIFEIDTIYKGEHAGDTVEVKTSNGFGLSPDLILYGEDETTVLSTSLDRFDLEVGSECILTLTLFNASPAIRSGYYVVGGKQGVFTPEQAELFTKLQ